LTVVLIFKNLCKTCIFSLFIFVLTIFFSNKLSSYIKAKPLDVKYFFSGLFLFIGIVTQEAKDKEIKKIIVI